MRAKMVITVYMLLFVTGSSIAGITNNYRHDEQNATEYRMIPEEVLLRTLTFPAYNTQADSYSEISLNDLPDSVGIAIARAYPGYAFWKAYKNNDNNYKVKISLKDDRKVLYYNKSGELLKEEEDTSSMDK